VGHDCLLWAWAALAISRLQPLCSMISEQAAAASHASSVTNESTEHRFIEQRSIAHISLAVQGSPAFSWSSASMERMAHQLPLPASTRLSRLTWPFDRHAFLEEEGREIGSGSQTGAA
jgi:hypothetical protein